MLKILPFGLISAIVIYLLIALTYHQDMGIVGEVSSGWTKPPKAFVEVEPTLWTDPAHGDSTGGEWGPFVANQTRPIERIGQQGLPLAINQHTGGLSDWPAWGLNSMGLGHNEIRYFYFFLGAILIGLTFRFLIFHASLEVATIASFVLASDWGYLFYKSALGGTEILLQGSLLLILWGVWSRRWGGGRHGLWPISIGIGLGIQAKLTFALPLTALAITLFVMRWDKPLMKPPLPKKWLFPLLATLLLISPLLLAWMHHWHIEKPFNSHDFAQLQLNRTWNTATGGETPARENWFNLWFWLTEPLAFFEEAYDVKYNGESKHLRYIGWLICILGASAVWKQRQANRKEALLRLLSPFLCLSLFLVAWIGRDMHHFAMLTPIIAIWIALSIDAVAGSFAPSRSLKRTFIGLLLCVPFVSAGFLDSTHTPTVINRVSTPTFSNQKQEQLTHLLESAKVQRLTTMDYEIYGVLEKRMPELDVQHAWPMIRNRRVKALPGILKMAKGGHLISLKASAPMSYNLRPSRKELDAAAKLAGIKLKKIGSWSNNAIVLWQVM